MRVAYRALAWLGIPLILGIVLLPLLVPIPELEGTVPPQTLAGPESEFVSILGLNVHVERAGAGTPPLVLLHGFGASTFTWNTVVPEMAEWSTVVAFDRPAFGLTERPLTWEGANPYSMPVQAELTIGLLDAYGFKDAVLVGSSAGGTVAVETALAFPDRVRALVLVDPAIYRTASAPRWLLPILKTPQFDRIGPWLVRQAAESWGERGVSGAWHDTSKVTAEIWDGYRRPFLAENWDRALWAFVLAGAPGNLPERLREVELPVLVVTGDDDRLVPTADSIRLADELPDAELVVIESCGHLPHEECPHEFLRAVERFLVTRGLLDP